MQLWAEIHDGTTTYGITKLVSATITKRLDAAGSFEVGMVPVDPVVIDHMSVGMRLRIKALIRGRDRLLMEGRALSRRVSGRILYWSGLDGIDELRGQNTFFDLVYNNQDLRLMVRDLIRKASGWDVYSRGDIEGFVTRRFDGESILAALRWVTQTYGYHFRTVEDENRLIFGEMGVNSGVRIIQTGRMTRELENNPNFAILATEPELLADAFDIENSIVPIMGPVDWGITLERADRSTPYPILTTEKNGRTIYYIQDQNSVDRFGERWSIFQPADLVLPIDNSTEGVLNVANVLYEASAQRLKRYRRPNRTYSLNVIKLDRDVSVGEKVRLVYKGIIRHEGRILEPVEVDSDLWVMETQEQFNPQGRNLAMTCALVDRYPVNPALMLVENMRRVEGRQTQRVLTAERNKATDTVTINQTTTDSTTFEVQDTTAYLSSARVILTRADEDGPSLVTVTLDGTDLPDLYFGSSKKLTDTIDITSDLRDGGAEQGTHTLAFSCQEGSGDIDVEVQLVEALVGIGV